MASPARRRWDLATVEAGARVTSPRHSEEL